MNHEVILGYYNSDFFSDHDLKTLESQVKSSTEIECRIVEFQKEEKVNNLDFLLTFSDDDLLTLVDSNSGLPTIIPLEVSGDNSFFADFPLSQFGNVLELIGKGQFEEDCRTTLSLVFNDASKDAKALNALNDILISSSKINQRMRFDISIDGVSLYENLDTANSILVSTPTGSTALSLNLGGAIIDPYSSVFQIQTVASRNVMTNHHIINDDSNIEIEIIETKFPLVFNLDNREIRNESPKFQIFKADQTINLAKFTKTQIRERTKESKLRNKINFEDTKSLSSSAKFVLHILQSQQSPLTSGQISDITGISNQKTVNTALNLLMNQGLIKRKTNIQDLRSYLYYIPATT